MNFRCIVLCLLLMCLIPCACAEDLSLCPTDAWTPPDLSNLTAEDPIPLRMLRIAQQEVGYTEDANGLTKYVTWFGSANYAWCTEFFSWCVHQADLEWGTEYLGTLYPNTEFATSAGVFYHKYNRYIGADGKSFDGEKQWLKGEDDYLTRGGYIPEPGDAIFFYLYDKRDKPDHTGIVEGVSQDSEGRIWVHVIEGNIDPFVRRHAYEITDPDILGYGTIETKAYTLLAKYSRYGGLDVLFDELKSLGYKTGPKQHWLESAMVSAIRAFQKDHNLPITGKMDIETRNALNKALEAEKQ